MGMGMEKDMCKTIGKNISKNLRGKYSPGILALRKKVLDHAKESATDAFKATSKRAIQKAAEATVDLIGNKIANKIMGFQTIRNKLVQKHLQMSMIKKYLNKYINLQMKGKKILMSWD